MKTSTDEEDNTNFFAKFVNPKVMKICCYAIPGFMPSFLF